MKVTVVMPVHNREMFIEEAIESILNQTFEDFELLVLDDFSTDRTVEVVKNIKDDRIRLVELPLKSNIPILRNAGISMAKGEYIAFMDSDDISTPQRLEKEVDFLDSHPDYGVVSGNYQFFGDYDKFYEMPKTNDRIVNHLLFRSTIANGASMFRRSLITDMGVTFRSEYFACEDYAFWVDLIGKTKMENLDETFLYVRSGHPSITQETWGDNRKLRLRKAILDEIHRTAFANLGIKIDEAELTLFNSFIGDSNRGEHDASEVQQLEELFESLKKRMVGLPLVSVPLMEEQMEQRLNRFKTKYKI